MIIMIDEHDNIEIDFRNHFKNNYEVTYNKVSHEKKEKERKVLGGYAGKALRSVNAERKGFNQVQQVIS